MVMVRVMAVGAALTRYGRLMLGLLLTWCYLIGGTQFLLLLEVVRRRIRRLLLQKGLRTRLLYRLVALAR